MLRNTIIKSSLIAIFLAFAGGLLFMETALAHAAYLRSNPGADAIIATSPPIVEIWFKQEVFRRQGENIIAVTDAQGKTVSVGDTTVDDDNRKHLLVHLQPSLPAGVYTVKWKNTSLEDGHPSDGSFAFTIDSQAKVTSTPMSDVSPTPRQHPTETENAPAHASPTAPVKPTPVNGPCAASLVPVLGLAGFAILRRQRPQR